MNTWLMKSEPDVFSIDDLEKRKTAPWDGVRNFQARNFMRDGMKVGDLIIFYHSNAVPPGAAGVARVCRAAYPDHTAWDKKSEYVDPRASPENPLWLMVDVAFVEKFPVFVPLDRLKMDPKLSEMMVIRKGMRLSVQPVSAAHFARVVELGQGRTQI